MLPDGFHEATEADFSGYDRPTHVIDNQDELELHFAEARAAGTAQISFVCNYCENVYRARTLERAIRWWLSHDCQVMERRELGAILFDLAA